MHKESSRAPIAYPDDRLMAATWASAVRVAAETPEVIAAYERDRGCRFLLGQKRTPLDAMIDSATGADQASAEDFIAWFNAEVWGENPFKEERPDAP